MQRGYHDMFPQAEFTVILRDSQGVGRIIVHRTAEEYRIVDMALLPEQRGSGVGAILVRRVLEQAHRANLPVRLRVLKGGRSSHLCQRLGFQDLHETGAYEHWEWRSRG